MALVSVLPALSGGGGGGVGWGEAGLAHRSPLCPAFLACAEPAGLRHGLGPPRIRPHLHSCGRRSDALHCVPQAGSGPHGPHTGVQGDSLFGNVRQTAQRRFKVLMVTLSLPKKRTPGGSLCGHVLAEPAPRGAGVGAVAGVGQWPPASLESQGKSPAALTRTLDRHRRPAARPLPVGTRGFEPRRTPMPCSRRSQLCL